VLAPKLTGESNSCHLLARTPPRTDDRWSEKRRRNFNRRQKKSPAVTC
jgi:hypothetical protein